MKISLEFRPERIVGEDDSRYSPDYCYLDLNDPVHPVLVSTDGRMMTVVPVSIEEGDVEGPIPARALRFARKLASFLGERIATVQARDAVTVPAMRATFDRPEGTFPDWRKAVPAGGSATFVVDVYRLMAVARALGATADQPRLTLNYEPGDTGNVGLRISRTTDDDQTARGYLMTARAER